MRQKKIVIAVLVLLVILIVSVYLLRGRQFDQALVLYGNVDLRQVALAFKNSDRIEKLNVEEGDTVKSGQVLGKLDTQTLQLNIDKAHAEINVQTEVLKRLRNGSRPQEIDQARAEVAAAQAEADNAAAQFARVSKIYKETEGAGISHQEVDAAKAAQRKARAQLENQRKAFDLAKIGPRKEDIAQAQAQLEAAQASLALLNHQLEESKLISPVNGVIRSRLLEPGDMASAQRPVYTLAISSPKWIRAYVQEIHLGRVKPGMKTQVYIDSYPDQPLNGQIGFISSMAEFTPKTVQTDELRTSLVYEVRVMVQDPDNRLRLGMPATIRFPRTDRKS